MVESKSGIVKSLSDSLCFSAVSLHIQLFTGNKHWDCSSLETVPTIQIQLTMCHLSYSVLDTSVFR